MTYRIEIEKSAAKSLQKIQKRDRVRITEQIKALANDPRPAGSTKMTDSDSYRIRVGNYRVVYLIADRIRVVTVTSVGHRREVYR